MFMRMNNKQLEEKTPFTIEIKKKIKLLEIHF